MSESIRLSSEIERSPEVTVTPSAPARVAVLRRQRLRLIVLVVLTAAGLYLAHRAGLAQRLTAEAIRENMAEAGALGVLIYLGLFAIRDFLRVPGFALVGAAVLAFGPWQGGLLGFLGANLGVTVCFLVTRAVGGKALVYWDRPLAQRLLARLDHRPVLVVALLRSVFASVSPLTWTLAISNVRLRDHLIGSFLGLISPTIVVTSLWALLIEGMDGDLARLFGW
jgi:uncharacterized membrane protein YdjX (TVP38/TMEM64 family)